MVMGSAIKAVNETCQSIMQIGLKKNTTECENCSNNLKTKDERTPLKRFLSNPFEIGLPERLNFPSISPSCINLNIITKKEQNEKTFRWSIDQMACLNPAEFDESSQPSILNWNDHDYEEKAQEAIDSYFSQKEIVPSPWMQCNTKSVPKSMRKSVSIASSLATNLRKPKHIKSSQDASTQTSLTLPVNFDLEKILGEFYTYTEEEVSQVEDEDEEEEEQEESNVLSASTLRRKLFFQEDSLNETPIFSSTALLSSSPVRVMGEIKRTSLTPLKPLISPTVSPISSAATFDFSDESSYVCADTESMVLSLTQNPVISRLELDSPQSCNGFKMNSTVQSSNHDTGYQTYDTESHKTPQTDFRMSWTPTRFSTPSTKTHCSQLAMSIDEQNC